MATHAARRLAGSLLSAGAVMVMLAGCSINPATGKRQLILISREQEIAMGNEAAPQFEQEFGGRVDNQALQSYLHTVGKKVAGASERPMPYEFTLLRSGTPNAFALPGGKIFVTAGLMARMTNERQLAAVLGHEVAHVAARHNVMGMQRQMGAGALVMIAGRIAGRDRAEAAKDVTRIVTSVANLSYSRDDEHEADEYGIKYMARAGHNPWGMVELLEILGDMARSEPTIMGQMFSSHPMTDKRIEETEQIIFGHYAKYSRNAPDPHAGRFRKMHRELMATIAAGR